MSEKKETIETYKFANHKEWHEAMQEAPHPNMIQTRTISGSQQSKYVPIGVQEALADIFYREFDIFYNDMKIHNNQVVITVKISVLPNYPNSEHRTICGIAAKPLGQSKNSLESKAPGTQSSAKSNALTNVGNIFGRNLNREFSDNFSYTSKKEKDAGDKKD